MPLDNIFSFLLIFIILSSCDKDDPDSIVSLPTNLEAFYALDEEGLATFELSADNANFYSLSINEDTEDTYIEDFEGVFTYEFSSSGDHEVIARAHSSSADFIEENLTISLDLDDGTPQEGPPNSGYETALSYPNYNLVWNDEFDGNSLSSDWANEIGTGNNGWGNNELQFYRAENTHVGNGVLTITAKTELFNGMTYTSSRIKTQGMKSFRYGRVDIRAALPFGQGVWPALWMLGDNFSTVGWPACGEIDIAEMVGGAGNRNSTVHGTIHWQQSGSHAEFGNSYTINNGILADNWHVYSIVWDENKIEWYIDDIKYNEVDITPSELSEFHENFFFIMNVAVGGNWPGSPDLTTQFPQRMFVDYIRVFQQ